MTRKDYIKIAEAVNLAWKANDKAPADVLHYVVSELCVVLQQDNSNFNRQRFIEACYKE